MKKMKILQYLIIQKLIILQQTTLKINNIKSKINETVISEAARADAVELDDFNSKEEKNSKIISMLNRKKIKLLSKYSANKNHPSKKSTQKKTEMSPQIIIQKKPDVPRFK